LWDLEAGPYAREYLAWNFNSGMAAIDAALARCAGAGGFADHGSIDLWRGASVDL